MAQPQQADTFLGVAARQHGYLGSKPQAVHRDLEVSVKSTATDQRQNVAPLNDGRSRGELELRSRAWPSIAGQIQAPESMAGVGFVVGGLVAAAASAVQFIIDQGQYLPEIVFASLHVLGPLALAIPAAGGFIVERSHLARRLSILAVGFFAVWAGWNRFDLPSLDWTGPRLLFAAIWIAGGVRLLTRRGTYLIHGARE